MIRHDRPGAPEPDGARLPLHRRHPVALTVTALVVLGGLLGPAALSTPTGGVPEASLRVGWGYLAMAPVAGVLDALSVLTLGQHYAFLGTLILVYAGWRVLRRRTRGGWLRRTGIEIAVAVASLLGLAAFYGYGMVGPRPMAELVPHHPDDVVVDVHSHTDASHDAREGFGPEDNRAWHAAAGFDAVYVSDHRNWQGWRAAVPGNPARAGDGTSLLPALEILWQGKYANALGAPERYRAAVEGNRLIADSVYALWERGAPRPTLVLTIPEQLDSVRPATADSVGFVAIEVSDASPKGLRQSRRDRALILRMVDSLDLAPVAASNNHGWGRTAAAWTLIRIPGWRERTPDALNAAIEERLHSERAGASRVVERRSPYFGSSVPALALTAPAVLWQMFGGLGFGQRVAWLAWAWGLALVIARLGTPSQRTSGR
ncbi:MAG: hypothetical protein R3314_04635 [Longimicrobiales bacterium]|nr:hypothetical protein [Longimicrobiales bacterium]